ncbi:MAG: alpha/beta hydrolase [Novosphingobium sp.]
MEDTQDLLIAGAAGQLSVRTKGLSARPAKVVIMVQGSNLTGQSMFDFAFPGGERYSLMDEVVAMGFGAITFAVRGYGASTAPADPRTVTTDAAIEDLASVIDWARDNGHDCPHILAFSWGGRIAGRYAERHAERIGRLILCDPARGGGNLVLPAPTEPWFVNTPQFYLEKFEPEFTDVAFRTAMAAHVAEHEARSPNGIRFENARPTVAVNPDAITSPTLMIYGAQAAKAIYMKGGMERGEFFERLATDDKSFVILPGGGDFAHFQQARFRMFEEIERFLKAAPLAAMAV